MNKTVCFFARVKDPSALQRVEFYAQDVRILKDLGFDVHLATNISQICRADLYFIWWWTWAFMPLMVAAINRKPALVTGVFDHQRADGTWDIFLRPKWQQWLMRFTLKRADANVFISQLELESIPRLFVVNHPYYSPCAVDEEVYSPGVAPREDTILTIAWMDGTNAERKCIPEVVRAAAIIHQTHPEVKFIIVGHKGASYPGLARLAQELGADSYVEFPGIISKEEKIELMRRCKLYLQPSRTEGFGLAIAEAMSCGAPVVTSPVGTVPEVAGDAVAYVDDNSPSSIAAVVNRLLAESSIREDLSRRSHMRIQSMFPYERRKRDIQMIIERLLDKPRNHLLRSHS